jgi:hypothetical protein
MTEQQKRRLAVWYTIAIIAMTLLTWTINALRGIPHPDN